MRPLVSLFALLAGLGAPTLRAEVEFVGHAVAVDETTRFLLAEPVTKTTSGWLLVGVTWAGHTLTAFDPRTTLLSVERADGTTIQLKPKGPRPTADRDPAVAAAELQRQRQASQEAQRETLALLRKMSVEHAALRARLAEIDAGPSPADVLRPAGSDPSPASKWRRNWWRPKRAAPSYLNCGPPRKPPTGSGSSTRTKLIRPSLKPCGASPT